MKKVLSVFLSFVMVLGMLPMTALADSTDEAVPEVTEKIEAIAEPQEEVSPGESAATPDGQTPEEEETETSEPEEEPQTEVSEPVASETDANDAEEEEIGYAELSLTASASDGAVVTVAGRLPVGTELVVEKVFFSAAEVAELLGTTEENVEDYAAYNVTLLLDGKEIEPDGEVIVVIIPPADFTCEEELSVVHIEDNGATSEVPAEVSEDRVAFSLDSFSIILLGAKRNPDTVAVIGDAEYNNLAEAFAAAEDGDTVQLVKNIYYNGDTISVNKDVTFDCNNHQLTNPSSSYVFDVAAGGKLSFVNLWTDLDGGLVNENYGAVSFVSTGFAGASCDNSNGYFVYKNYGVVEVLDGQYTDCYALVEYTGEDESADFSVTITGGSFCGQYIVDYVYGKSTVNISNVTAPNIYCWIYALYNKASAVIENSTFNSTGYFIEYVGDNEGDEGTSVTLKNVTAISQDESFYEVRGTLTAESCNFTSKGNDFIVDSCADTVVVLTDVNISADYCVFDDMYGSVTINGGVFVCGSDFIYSTDENTHIVIMNAEVTADGDLFDDFYGYAEINGGVYDCSGCIFDCVYVSAIVNGGSFTSGGYAFDDVYGSVTLADCEVTARSGNAVYCSSSESNVGHVVINGGTYISETEESIYVSDGSVEITDGTFTSLEDGDSALYISDSAEAVLTGGIFAAGGNVCAFDGTVDGDAIKGLTMPATTLTPSRFALLQPAEQKKTRFPSARH